MLFITETDEGREGTWKTLIKKTKKREMRSSIHHITSYKFINYISERGMDGYRGLIRVYNIPSLSSDINERGKGKGNGN